jgi:hypothetical protein
MCGSLAYIARSLITYVNKSIINLYLNGTHAHTYRKNVIYEPCSLPFLLLSSYTIQNRTEEVKTSAALAAVAHEPRVMHDRGMT